MFCYMKATCHTGGHVGNCQTRREGCYGWAGFVYYELLIISIVVYAAPIRDQVILNPCKGINAARFLFGMFFLFIGGSEQA